MISFVLVLNSFTLCATQIFAGSKIMEKNIGVIIAIIFFGIVEIILIIILARQPRNKKSLYFQVHKQWIVES